MNAQEVAAEFDRRMDVIYELFDLAVEAFKAARKQRDAAIRDLNIWFDETFDSLVKEEVR